MTGKRGLGPPHGVASRERWADALLRWILTDSTAPSRERPGQTAPTLVARPRRDPGCQSEPVAATQAARGAPRWFDGPSSRCGEQRAMRNSLHSADDRGFQYVAL